MIGKKVRTIQAMVSCLYSFCLLAQALHVSSFLLCSFTAPVFLLCSLEILLKLNWMCTCISFLNHHQYTYFKIWTYIGLLKFMLEIWNCRPDLCPKYTIYNKILPLQSLIILTTYKINSWSSPTSLTFQKLKGCTRVFFYIKKTSERRVLSISQHSHATAPTSLPITSWIMITLFIKLDGYNQNGVH